MTTEPDQTNHDDHPGVRSTAGFATVDHDRAERCGHGEVIYAAGKLPREVVAIAEELLDKGSPCVLATRCDVDQVAALREAFADDRPVDVGERSGAVIVGTPPKYLDATSGGIPIVTAGTSDLRVAEEAVMTCRALGFAVKEINDVGVAGLHRILNRSEEVRSGNCVIVVAGMEGALPSVVGGMVDVPVIAVPTSVGYGASFGGLSALLGMLNSCASGVTVVNIDNGFGGAYAACQIERMVMRAVATERETAGNG
ncbi:MAG: nickel pincer cofactor biosynthesis protein LarB [Planctomycetota bacterium]